MVVEACKVDTYYPAPCPNFTIFSKIYYILQRAISVTWRAVGEGSELGRMKIGKEPGVSKDRGRGLRGRERDTPRRREKKKRNGRYKEK